MLAGSVQRGVRNAWRRRTRSVAVVVLLAASTGALALMAQSLLLSRAQIASMEKTVRTLIELREAGAFGTGGFGKDKPVGEEHFSVDTLAAVRRIPSASHIARVDEYVYRPDMDPSKKNVYAMVIGLRPGAALRAIGEVDYESTRIVAGRTFRAEDGRARVAVVGRLYALQRLGVADPGTADLAGRRVVLNGDAYELIGIYSTGNDFGDNHVFVPIEAFRATYQPGPKLSKIFVTVDSVTNVERVVAELRALPEADVVTTPEAVSTARTTLGGLAAAGAAAAVLLFAVGATLVVFTMVLSFRERIAEIGTLKAIGAPTGEVVAELVAETLTLSALGGAGALLIAAVLAPVLRGLISLPVAFDAQVALFVVAGSAVFALLGCVYPVARALRLSPVQAMRAR